MRKMNFRLEHAPKFHPAAPAHFFFLRGLPSPRRFPFCLGGRFMLMCSLLFPTLFPFGSNFDH
jgi:hypothetical protein